MSQTLSMIKENIKSNVGKNVLVISRCRRKESQATGVLDGAYESLFTVVVDDNGSLRKVCHTYTDVLTKVVTVRPLKQAQ